MYVYKTVLNMFKMFKQWSFKQTGHECLTVKTSKISFKTVLYTYKIVVHI